jgi:hypothetical protein
VLSKLANERSRWHFISHYCCKIIDWIFWAKVAKRLLIGYFPGKSYRICHCWNFYRNGTLAKKINGEKLKPAFGWFVLVMGIYIIIKETLN